MVIAVSVRDEPLESVAAQLRRAADADPITLPGAPGPQHAALLANGILVVFARVVVCDAQHYQLSVSRPGGYLDEDQVWQCVRAFFPESKRVRVFENGDTVHAVETLPLLS